MSQTPDTDSNEHVRGRYGNKKKMRMGLTVPSLTHGQCLTLMLEVLSDLDLHRHPAQGYKTVWQSIDLHGREDALIVREAGECWREETSNKRHSSMRPWLNGEIAAVAGHYDAGDIAWNMHDVKRLICTCPANRQVDNIVKHLGEDYFHDDVHNMSEAENDMDDGDTSDDGDAAAIADDDNAAAVADDNCDVTAVADDDVTADVADEPCEDIVPLSCSQADAVQRIRVEIAALQLTMHCLEGTGQLKMVQCMESEIHKLRRRERDLVRGSPADADTFKRLRIAEDN